MTLAGRATGAGFVAGGAVGGVVTGATARGLAVAPGGGSASTIVTGLGFTVVDVEVDVDVDVDDEVVLDVDGGAAGRKGGVRAGVEGVDAEASVVHHTNVAPAMATTASTAATL